MKKIISIIALLFTCSCVNSDRLYEIIENDGVTNVNLTGYAWTGCSKDDTISQKFTGTKNNKSVNGVICGGWLKAYTVRYY